MTPAERLLAAADLLGKRANEAEGQMAGYGPTDYYFGCSYSQIQRDGMGGEIGEFGATMHPEVGKAIAVALRVMGETVKNWDPASASSHATLLLPLADLVLASGEQT